MKCNNHPEVDMVATCIACGKSICESCRVEFKGENYCKSCLSKKAGEETKKQRSPVLAGILSFFIAGAGQIYNGQIGKGILIFFTAWLIIPYIYGIIDACITAQKINEGKIQTKERTGCLIALVVAAVCIIPATAILGLLTAIAIPNFLRAREEAWTNRCRANLQIIQEAKEKYRADNGLDYDAIIPLSDENGINDGDGIPDVLEVYINGEIVCPKKGRYEIGKFSEVPRCSIGINFPDSEWDDHILK